MVLALSCAALGVVVGRALTVVVARVPDRDPVGSDLARLARRPLGPTPGRHSPVLEVATAALFAGAAVRLGADAALPAFLVLFAALVAVTVIDLEHYIVPNRIVFPVLAASVVLLGLAALVDGDWSSLRTAIIGSVAAGGGLLVINLISPAGMGMGDVKLALVLGLFLGWLELALVFAGLFLGFLLGAVGGVVLIALGLRSRRDHVPFAPFLAGGTVLAVLVGGPLASWFFG